MLIVVTPPFWPGGNVSLAFFSCQARSLSFFPEKLFGPGSKLELVEEEVFESGSCSEGLEAAITAAAAAAVKYRSTLIKDISRKEICLNPILSLEADFKLNDSEGFFLLLSLILSFFSSKSFLKLSLSQKFFLFSTSVVQKKCFQQFFL